MADVNQVMPALKASGAQLLFMSQLHLDDATATLHQVGMQPLVLEQLETTRAGNWPWTARLI